FCHSTTATYVYVVLVLSLMFVQPYVIFIIFFFFFQAEDGIRDWSVTGVQTCALPILSSLPVPVSPLINTVESVGATFSTCLRTARTDPDIPTISSNIDARLISSRSTTFSFLIRSSARFRSSISVPVAYHRTICPRSSLSGLYWMRHQR